MSILDALTVKPWLPQPAPPHQQPGTPAASVGLNVLLAVVAAFFALLILALLIRAQLPDWRSLGAGAGAPLADIALLWVNTGVLLASSLALQAASVAARHHKPAATRWTLMLGGLLALAFLGGQLVVWRILVAGNDYVASNPAASFFYLMTGLHGLHLAGGLVAWARVALRARRGVTDERLHLGAALCARYWHFLLALWLVLFALLASPPQTLDALAEICGIR